MCKKEISRSAFSFHPSFLICSYFILIPSSPLLIRTSPRRNRCTMKIFAFLVNFCKEKIPLRFLFFPPFALWSNSRPDKINIYQKSVISGAWSKWEFNNSKESTFSFVCYLSPKSGLRLVDILLGERWKHPQMKVMFNICSFTAELYGYHVSKHQTKVALLKRRKCMLRLQLLPVLIILWRCAFRVSKKFRLIFMLLCTEEIIFGQILIGVLHCGKTDGTYAEVVSGSFRSTRW